MQLLRCPAEKRDPPAALRHIAQCCHSPDAHPQPWHSPRLWAKSSMPCKQSFKGQMRAFPSPTAAAEITAATSLLTPTFVGLQIKGTQVAFVQPCNLQRRPQGGIGSNFCTSDPGISGMQLRVSTSAPVWCVRTPNLMHSQAKVHVLCASICTKV